MSHLKLTPVTENGYYVINLSDQGRTKHYTIDLKDLYGKKTNIEWILRDEHNKHHVIESNAIAVKLRNIFTDKLTHYVSLAELANAFNKSPTTIASYLKDGKLLHNVYQIKFEADDSDWDKVPVYSVYNELTTDHHEYVLNHRHRAVRETKVTLDEFEECCKQNVISSTGWYIQIVYK